MELRQQLTLWFPHILEETSLLWKSLMTILLSLEQFTLSFTELITVLDLANTLHLPLLDLMYCLQHQQASFM